MEGLHRTQPTSQPGLDREGEFRFDLGDREGYAGDNQPHGDHLDGHG